jgi:L,D-transpeptidase ErfK/SrfK
MPLVAVRALLLAVVFALACLPAEGRLNPDMAATAIVINLPSRTLELYSQGSLVKVYRVAIGKPSTPTPLGEFSVFEKEVDPWWFPPRTGEAVPSGPANPLGYRWMGFSPLYGIHGTNAPWAIGQAVSNGCVRMFEEDVEELFDVVPYGTPVRVTYDRVKVLVDSQGEVSVGVYPDIYGYRQVTAAEVVKRLAAVGLAGFVSDGEAAALVAAEADRQMPVARLHAVRVNGKGLAEPAVTVQGTLYVPLWPLAAALGLSPVWDEPAGLVRGTQRAVPAVVRGDRLYVTAADAHMLFGGQQEWLPEANTLAVDVVAVFVNGKPLKTDVQAVDGVLALPLAAVAEAVGQRLGRAADGSPTVQGSPVPHALIGEMAYIQLTKIYDVFKAYVYWNPEGRTIELTCPYNVKGGSD